MCSGDLINKCYFNYSFYFYLSLFIASYIKGLGNNIKGTITNAISKNKSYNDSYNSTEYKGNPLVDPPASGILIKSPIIEGAKFVPTTHQSVVHFIKIIMHIYPNVTDKNIICGKNSKIKSSGYEKYNAFDPLSKIPYINKIYTKTHLKNSYYNSHFDFQRVKKIELITSYIPFWI